ncbi:NAD(P)-dependent oxidoreductase, partial [Rhizobiaceae sp. 2RAB30]
GRADLGLPSNLSYGAVVPFLKDETLNSMKYAQATGAGYLSISSGLFELGPETAFYIHKPTAVPVVMASSWLAGVATFPTLR